MRWWVTVLTVGCFVPLGTVASAQDGTVASAQESPDREARRLFEAGELAFEDGRYEHALDHFERAYELSGRPELLYNVGQAADRLRQDRKALEAFELYLDARPTAENRRQVEARMRVLREQLAAAESSSENEASGDAPRRWWIAGVVGGAVAVLAVGLAVGFTRSGSTQDPLTGDVGAGGVVQTLRSW